MTDVYKAPESELIESKSLEGYGSLERGMAGQFEFAIGDTLKEAWNKVSGSKGKIWLAIILYAVIAVAASTVINILLSIFGMPSKPVPGQPVTGTLLAGFFIAQLLNFAVILPLGAGLYMIGIKIAVGASVESTEVVKHYDKAFTLLLAIILMYIISAIGFVLLIIPGIYLMVSYSLVMPLIIEKGLGPWQALEASRKAITKCWFRFFGYGLLMMLLTLVAMIPLGIGMIWVFPLMIISFGIIYRNIFGYEGTVNA